LRFAFAGFVVAGGAFFSCSPHQSPGSVRGQYLGCGSNVGTGA